MPLRVPACHAPNLLSGQAGLYHQEPYLIARDLSPKPPMIRAEEDVWIKGNWFLIMQMAYEMVKYKMTAINQANQKTESKCWRESVSW